MRQISAGYDAIVSRCVECQVCHDPQTITDMVDFLLEKTVGVDSSRSIGVCMTYVVKTLHISSRNRGM